MAGRERRPGITRGRPAALCARRRELPQVRRRPRLLDCPPPARALRLQGRAARDRGRAARPPVLHGTVRFRRIFPARGPGCAGGTFGVRHFQRRLSDLGAAAHAPVPPPARPGQVMRPDLERKVADLERLLTRVALEHAPAALASSLSAEDMVVTDAILRRKLDIEIFTLDTERLHADTLNVIAAIRERYGYVVHVFRPDPAAIAEYVAQFGRDAFYESVDLRKRCCHLRKVEPLERALEGKEAWITGQRRAQAATRTGLERQEYDAAHGIVKFNPLADWSEDEVWETIRHFGVP